MLFCAIDAIDLHVCRGHREHLDRRCGFEDGWCWWSRHDASENSVSWTLGGGTAKSKLPKPGRDHSLNSSEGFYIYLSNFGRKNKSQGEVTSSIFRNIFVWDLCMEFWYIISGNNETSLEVVSIYPHPSWSKHVNLWRQGASGHNTWQYGRIAVPLMNRAIFRGIVGPASSPAYIALDDIGIIDDSGCKTWPEGAQALTTAEQLSCDFHQAHRCHWYQTGGFRPAWMVGPYYKAALRPLFMPDVQKVHIIYFTGRFALAGNASYTEQSTFSVERQAEPVCVSLWYYMFGGRGATLELTLYHRSGAEFTGETILRNEGRTTADRWYMVRRSVSLDAPRNKLILRVEFQQPVRKEATVAVGPLEVTNGACPSTSPAEDFCDFEFDNCGWTSPGDGWIRSSRVLKHSCGREHSVYHFEDTWTPEENSSGVSSTLLSPRWPGHSQPRCLEFWYQTLESAKEDASLKAEVVVAGKRRVVWRRPPYPSSCMMLARVQIESEKSFQVMFTVRTASYSSQRYALDNIALRPEPCEHVAKCDFTDDLCGYVNEYYGDLRWFVGAGRREVGTIQTPVWEIRAFGGNLQNVIGEIVREELRCLLSSSNQPQVVTPEEIFREEVQHALCSPSSTPPAEAPALTYAAAIRSPQPQRHNLIPPL
ncbi:MAM and LDL-receptor class A domain-containing protein 1-like [Amblyomma americanum]